LDDFGTVKNFAEFTERSLLEHDFNLLLV